MNNKLIYSCVFHNEGYLDLIDLLLKSYSQFGNVADKADYLIICSPKFKDAIQRFFNKLNIKGKIWVLNPVNKFEACYYRLKIFDYPDIDQYDKILYLDTDLIICNDLNTILDIDLKEVLYSYADDDKTISDWGHGNIIFEELNIDFNPKQKAFSTAVLYFLNCKRIKKLFNDVIKNIHAICPNSEYTLSGSYDQAGKACPNGEHHIEGSYDQDFIIFQCVIDELYDINTINKYCQNNADKSSENLILNHFGSNIWRRQNGVITIPCGEPYGKMARMYNFYH